MILSASPTAASLIERVEQTWIDSTPTQQEAALAQEGQAMVTYLMGVGNHYAEQLTLPALDEPTRAKALHYTFEWPDGAKRFALLWRNLLLEWERASVHLAENRTQRSTLEVLAKAGKQQLIEAARQWIASSDQALQRMEVDPDVREQALYQWSLQDNPWPVYRLQLLALNDQLAELHQDFDTRISTAGTFVKLAATLKEVPQRLHDGLDELQARAERAISLIGSHADDELSEIPLEQLEALDPTDVLPATVEDIASEANRIIDELPQHTRLFIGDGNGNIRYRDIQLERQTGQWLSAEVMPDMFAAGKALERISADFGRTLIDVRSRISLAKDFSASILNDAEERQVVVELPTIEKLQKPLENYLRRLAKVRGEVMAAGTVVLAKVEDELRLSRVYEPEASFLEVSFEAGMSQVRRTQDALFNRFTAWVVEQRDSVRRLRHRVVEEETLSEGERIVRVLRTRRYDPHNTAYTSVVATRGFIGEAFHAGREIEIERAQAAIEAAREGFRGSIVITGQRYSGKTHFAELLAGRYFEQKTVRLRAGQAFEVAGRTMPGTHDLGEALAFVRKHSVGKRLLILIDDLELWANATVSLTANARALREAMDDLSGRLFFIITMGNWTFDRLEQGIELSTSVQLEINLDTMHIDAFRRTVLMRHVATHHVFVDQDGNEVSERGLRDHAEAMYRAAKGNVGDGLRRWAQSVRRADVATVQRLNKPQYQLPNFIDAETGVVLAAVKRRRYVNEYELRKLFGPAFDLQYRSVVQRLTRLQVLMRHRTGSLTINPVISNEIGRLLQRDGHLRAAYSRTPIQL